MGGWASLSTYPIPKLWVGGSSIVYPKNSILSIHLYHLACLIAILGRDRHNFVREYYFDNLNLHQPRILENWHEGERISQTDTVIHFYDQWSGSVLKEAY